MIRRVTAPALFPPPSYSHASVVEAGTRLAFLAGAVPLTADGELVGPGDPVRQAEQVIANLREQLRAVGSDLEHVLVTEVYVVADEPATLSEVWKVVEASGLSRGPHSSTLLGVSCLGYTGQLVEITATAAVPEPAERRPATSTEPEPAERRPVADTVVLRRAGTADAGAAADVWLRSFATALPTVGRAHSDDEVRAYFRDVVVPSRETWVADADGDVVGLMVLGDDEVSQLYLAPDWRGRGLGDRFVALAKERRPQGLTLWTFQVNAPAHRFYERHGFVAAEYTDGSGNEEREPDVRYVWRP
ncbi:hypothetical protein ACE1SV_16330 [Streptomyces sp. E-15]